MPIRRVPLSPDEKMKGGRAVPRERLLYTPDEAATLLALGRSTLYELIGSGRLASVTIGRSRRIPAENLLAFVKDLRGR